MKSSLCSSILLFLLVIISIYKPHPKCKNLYLIFLLLAYISCLNHNLEFNRKKLFFSKAISYLDRTMVVFISFFIFICFKKYFVIYLCLLYTIFIYFFIIPKLDLIIPKTNLMNSTLKSFIHSTIHIHFIFTTSYLYYSF